MKPVLYFGRLILIYGFTSAYLVTIGKYFNQCFGDIARDCEIC
ncbi:MAG: hypothetical protein ACE5HW_02735 [Candidatus Methanofastidiosia archaeon]